MARFVSFALWLGACSGPAGYVPPPAPREPLAVLPPPSAASAATSAPAPAPLSPVAADLPGSLPRLERRFECVSACALPGFVPSAALVRSLREQREAPAAIWQHSLSSGASLRVPRHRGLDLLALVFAGSVRVRGDEGGAEPTLARWDALYASGAGVGLQALEPSDVYLVLVSRDGTLGGALDAAAKQPREVRWTSRAAPLAVAHLATLSPASWGRGAYHARIAFGAPNGQLGASMTLLLAAPRASVPENVHPEAWEHIAILAGDGIMRQSGHEYPVSPGSLFQVAQGSPHAYVGGDAPMAAILVFSPSGPEQRFLDLAAAPPR